MPEEHIKIVRCLFRLEKAHLLVFSVFALSKSVHQWLHKWLKHLHTEVHNGGARDRNPKVAELRSCDEL